MGEHMEEWAKRELARQDFERKHLARQGRKRIDRDRRIANALPCWLGRLWFGKSYFKRIRTRA